VNIDAPQTSVMSKQRKVRKAGTEVLRVLAT